MALIRRDPFRDMLTFRDSMNRLFDESFFRPWTGEQGEGQGVFVPIDMSENDEAVTLSAPLPGIKPEDVDITVTGNTLTIQGEFREDDEGERGSLRYRERRYGSFRRSLTLPDEVKADEAEATFEDGVLKLRLPKAEEAKPKQISVKAK